MNAAGMLVPPPPAGRADARSEAQRLLWAATRERMELFLPGFLAFVIPEPEPEPEPETELVPAPVTVTVTEPVPEAAAATTAEEAAAAGEGVQ